jgi:hypothetical protein
MSKVCSECKQILELSCFNKKKTSKDGHHEYCKPCRKAQYLRRDRESAIKRSASRYAANKELLLQQMGKHYKKTAEQKRAYGREHYAKNKHMYLSNAMLRKAHVRLATPIWFDDFHKFVMREAFKLAKLREQVTKIPWDVDHVIPLRGKTVCGLNVMENIAVIPRVVNNYKRTKFYDNDRTLFYSRKASGK